METSLLSKWDYNVHTRVVRSHLQGIPVRRDRLYIVAILRRNQTAAYQWPTPVKPLKITQFWQPRDPADDPLRLPGTIGGDVRVDKILRPKQRAGHSISDPDWVVSVHNSLKWSLRNATRGLEL